MTEQREQELVSASIDGELNGDERIELDSLLESSSEARELKTELEQLDSLLNELPDLDPPPSLHASIMAQSEPRRAENPTSAFSWLRDLVPGSGLRYVLATGAGALVALIVVGGQPLDPVPFDYSQMVGTMSPNATQDGSDILDSYTFSMGAIAGQMQLRRVGDVMFLDIEADTDQPLDIAADFGGAGLSPDLVAQVDGRAKSIAIAGQAIQVKTSGKQRLTILLRRVNDAKTAGEAEISLEISSEGRVLDTGVLTASW
jgi:hypothetical protein